MWANFLSNNLTKNSLFFFIKRTNWELVLLTEYFDRSKTRHFCEYSCPTPRNLGASSPSGPRFYKNILSLFIHPDMLDYASSNQHELLNHQRVNGIAACVLKRPLILGGESETWERFVRNVIEIYTPNPKEFYNGKNLLFNSLILFFQNKYLLLQRAK